MSQCSSLYSWRVLINCLQVECYQRAVRLDQYLAVAYFQQGVSNFLVGDFEEALANFNDTLLYLRGNNMIDYAQLGLMFKLYSCEVLFNRGLCYIYLQQKEAGMQDFSFAVKEKVVEDHNVIDEAIREEAEVRQSLKSDNLALLTRIRATPSSQSPLVLYIDPIKQRSRT
jgi:tetratricopeptide (TPR) repeat protein